MCARWCLCRDVGGNEGGGASTMEQITRAYVATVAEGIEKETVVVDTERTGCEYMSG